jgi:hypothetical protein
MGLLNDIKNQVKKSGSNKNKFTYFKAGTKVRIRFLQDMEDGKKVLFHDSFALGINIPCQTLFDRECEHCDNEDLRHREQYMWSVYNYETKQVEIFMFPVNQCSPIPALVGMYETYGTLTDRDYVITKQGQQQSTSFSVVPMDKVKFKNNKAKPYSESKMLSLLDKAFPDDGEDTDDEDEDEEEQKPKKNKNKDKKSSKSKKHEEEDDEDDEDQDDDDTDDVDYDDMTAKELYTLCKERDIEVKSKQKEAYYIKKLEKYDIREVIDTPDEDDDWNE